ncbi:cellulose biosynthesis protein BcsC [Burkholderia ubonensis]|uniref:cellulose biosynthesis protein BcsC n=1 Tax=Burkholderia ubonensis TaxID=101571 RepID=UPI00075E2547|nr:cellulose synthase [Burkholderia ubonensis]
MSAMVLSLALAGLVTLTPSAAVYAAELDPMKTLVNQGKYWQAHGRGDLAEPAWQKVLSIDPKQPEALFGMGMALADRKDSRGAAEYLERLRQVAPDYQDIDALGRRLGQTSEHDEQLNDARRLAQMGQSASAVQAYQQAMSGKPATPDLRREYYQALAATPNGWNEARHGLEALAREHPSDPHYTLAFAQHLTYREATRREGIERLEQLANDSQVGHAAQQAWRQALLWLAARPSDKQRFDAYLKVMPSDPAVEARYDSMLLQDKEARARAQRDAAITARGRTIAEGFAALDHNDFATARDRFASMLASSPNDADALGGMGIIELKQERFEQARNYLERASRAGGPTRWREALTSATYWTYTSQALGAQSNGQFTSAKSLFERAITLNPSDVTAQIMLGNALLDHRDAPGAEQAYRMALRRQADHPDAIRGLVGALAAQGRGDEALQYAEQLTAEQQVKAGGFERLRSTAEAARARTAEARGDLGQARSLFEDALVGNPDDPWLRLDLARIYVRQGAIDMARSMMDGLLATHPDMVDALYASALLAEQTRDGAKGLQLLDRIPVEQRTLAMTVLQHRLWVYRQIELATQMARRGANPQAIAALRDAERFAQETPSLRGEVAAGYVAIGDTNRALSLAQRAIAQAPNDTSLLLQYADILLATHQDAPLGAVMRRLAILQQFTPEQRTHVDSLNQAIVIRAADALRQRGDFASSYVVIAPWLTAMPDNPDLQAALARLYASAGDPSNALKCYQVALARRPDDLGLETAAIYAATGAKMWRFAEQTARTALHAAPDDRPLLAAVGRMYRAQGKLALASEFLQRALVPPTPLVSTHSKAPPANAPRSWDAAMQSVGAHLVLGTNPFEGKTATNSLRTDDTIGLPPPDAMEFASPSLTPPSPLNLPAPPTTVPTYLPPAPPATYVPPSVTPDVPASSGSIEPVSETLRPSSTHSIENARARLAADSFGPNSDGASESGRPTAVPLSQPLVRYAYDASPPDATDLSPYAPPGPYVATPWPMSPATRTAQQANGTPARAAAPLRPGNRPTTQSRSRARALTHVTANRTAYARPDVPSADRMPHRLIHQPSYPPRDPQLDDAPAYTHPAQHPDDVSWSDLPRPPSDHSPRDAVAFVQADGAAAPSASTQTLGVADELAQVNRALTSSVSGGPTFRHRTGEDGLSNLTDLEASIEGRIRANNGHVVVTATPVTLDTGTAATDLPTRARFGAGLSNGTSPTSAGSQTASGVGLSVGYETASLKTHIGTTPVGFRYQSVLGDLQYAGGITDKVSYALAITRQAVTDSLLSYAGTRDAAAGLEWGGVTKTGARAALGWDDGTSGVYLNGEFQYYNGHHVANNFAAKGSAGVYTRFYQDSDHTFTVGVNATGMGFDKNQGYFTYGQGGYFSPQQYVILNLPIEYAGRTGAFTYDLKGSIGVQHYREDSVPYFPLDPSLQAQAKATMNGVTTATLDHDAVYPRQSKTGLAYSLYASGEYQMAPQLAIGAMASLGNANQYREWIATIYLRYSFTAQSLVQPFPPKVFVTPYLTDTD